MRASVKFMISLRQFTTCSSHPAPFEEPAHACPADSDLVTCYLRNLRPINIQHSQYTGCRVGYRHTCTVDIKEIQSAEAATINPPIQRLSGAFALSELRILYSIPWRVQSGLVA